MRTTSEPRRRVIPRRRASNSRQVPTDDAHATTGNSAPRRRGCGGDEVGRPVSPITLSFVRVPVSVQVDDLRDKHQRDGATGGPRAMPEQVVVGTVVPKAGLSFRPLRMRQATMVLTWTSAPRHAAAWVKNRHTLLRHVDERRPPAGWVAGLVVQLPNPLSPWSLVPSPLRPAPTGETSLTQAIGREAG